MKYKYDVFISYSRRDYLIADKIVNALNAGGFTYFREQQSLEHGMDFNQSFINAINSCRLFLCVLSEKAYSSEYVIKDLMYVLQKNGDIVLPIIVDNSRLPMELQTSIGAKKILNWQFSDNFDIENLIIQDISCALGRHKENLSNIYNGRNNNFRNNRQEKCDDNIPGEVDDDNYKIFISYKRNDKNVVFPLVYKIEQNTDEKCWIDLDGIESDAQFANVIIKAINKAQVFLFMYSHSHAEIEDYDTDWTVREINFAQKKRKRIVFVNIDGSPLSDWFELMFGTKQQIDASSKVLMEKLCRDLTKWLK